jgi:hypothetical protein
MTSTDGHARVIVLCERLAAATLGREADWAADGEDHFRWGREEGSVTIGARDRDGQPPYELAIFNGEGEKVEELTSALVDEDRPADWNEPLAELYRVARRSALHADDIIDALISSLPSHSGEGAEQAGRGEGAPVGAPGAAAEPL